MKQLLIFLSSVSLLSALTLDEAIERAIQLNPTIKEKKALYQSSQEQTDISSAGFKPTLDLSYSYDRYSKKANFIGIESASAGDARLGYNLFNGFSDYFNLKSAKENEQAARFTQKAAEADLRYQVSLAYVDYLRSQEQLRVSVETIVLLQQQRDDAQSFYEQGIFAKNDFLQVDVALATAQQSLLQSKRKIRLSFQRLKQLMGGSLEADESIVPLALQSKSYDPSILHQTMMENRSELKVLQAQHRGLNFEYKQAASPYYPKVDLEAKYQVAGVDPIPDGGPTFQTHDTATGTIKMTWNLYHGNADQAKRASLLSQEQASNERIQTLLLELDYQLEEATQDYTLAQSQIEVSQKALEQAKENFRITKNQFDANIANTTLMLDAQRFLASTQVDYYAAYYALYDAMAKIERVVEAPVF